MVIWNDVDGCRLPQRNRENTYFSLSHRDDYSLAVSGDCPCLVIAWPCPDDVSALASKRRALQRTHPFRFIVSCLLVSFYDLSVCASSLKSCFSDGGACFEQLLFRWAVFAASVWLASTGMRQPSSGAGVLPVGPLAGSQRSSAEAARTCQGTPHGSVRYRNRL